MNKFWQGLIGLGALGLGSVAQAKDIDTEGFYLGLGGGYSIQKSTIDWMTKKRIVDITGMNVAQKSKGLMGRLFAGYEFNRYWGAECGFLYGHKIRVRLDDSEPYLNTKRFTAFDFAAKIKVPIDEICALYAKAGAVQVNTSRFFEQASGDIILKNKKLIGAVVGLGIDSYVTEHLVASAEWCYYDYRNNKMDKALVTFGNTFTIAMRYQF